MESSTCFEQQKISTDALNGHVMQTNQLLLASEFRKLPGRRALFSRQYELIKNDMQIVSSEKFKTAPTTVAKF